MLGTREGRRQLWRGQSHLIDRVPFAGLRALSVWRLRSAIPTLNPSPSILSIRTKRVGVGQVGFELPAQDEASCLPAPPFTPRHRRTFLLLQTFWQRVITD